MHRISEAQLDGVAALIAAGETAMCKRKGEKDTEFVKRIVCAYVNALEPANGMRMAVLRSLSVDFHNATESA